MIKVALFDYDGTLADTDVVHHVCWNKSLTRYNTSIDGAYYAKNCSGALSIDIAEMIINSKPEVTTTASDLSQEKDAAYEAWIASNIVPVMPGVYEMLEFLERKGVRKGIVTGAPLAAIEKTLKDNKIFECFQVMVTREDVTRGKPEPDGYLLGLKKFGIEGHLAVAFEDTRSGVLAAMDAGIHTIAIPHNYTSLHDLSVADYICANMIDALEILKNSFKLSKE